MRASISPGIRVVRGPNWIWQNQEEGEGHVGTVCEIGRSGSIHSPENTVVVNWDSGHRTNYRVGYQNQYDLIIVDNAQIGIRHPNVVCDGCSKAGIAGIIFKCVECSNYHLCSYCYGADIHDKDHLFIRYTTPISLGVRVPPRKGSERIQLKGIFVGAKVVRGPDWEWGQQDGGEGKTGRVVQIRGWDNESCRSVANISWSTGSTNVYRLAHKGHIDLKYVIPASGGYYYKDHMPVLGHFEEQQAMAPSVNPMFSVGDRVKVCFNVDAVIKLQQGHGGWNPRMLEHLSKLGTVHRITEKGDIRVQYENCPNRWTFHPAALIRILSFRVGDMVTINNDIAKVQTLQKGHGEWIDLMRYALGKICKVIKVYSDGDLRIEQLDDGFEWTVNPKCVKLERSQLATAAERSNSMMDLSHRRTDHVMTPLSGLSGTSMSDKLVREAAQGHIEFVKEYLDAHPDQCNVISGGKSCIQVAAHQGFKDIVKLLISKGANVNVVDKEGDSALHYAAFGNQPETMRILLQNNSDINFLNSSHCSALHICAHKKTPHCIRELLSFGANVNIQDSYGDTALHDAIGKENTEVVEILCSAPDLDFTVKNKRGFNVLHHAALKGNVVAVRRILQLARQLVNVKKDDGFASLHLAALNGHAEVVEALMQDSQAEIDIRNNRRQTPFLLAVSQGHSSAIEKLIKLGCDITARDEDGDNAMNLCVIKKANLLQAFEPTAKDCPDIFKMYESLEHIHEHRLMYTILCYLSRLGCPIEENNKGLHIFNWISDQNLKKLLMGKQQSETKVYSQMPFTAASTSAVVTNNLPDMLLHNIQDLSLESKVSVQAIALNNLYVKNDDTSHLDKPSSSNHSTSSNIVIRKHLLKTPKINISGNTDAINAEPLNLKLMIHNPSVMLSTIPHECIVCNEIIELIQFKPCEHQISCEDCGKRMKKCLQCGSHIERRINCNGRLITYPNLTNILSVDRLRYLENKIQEYEESHYCSICMERRRDVAFLCGHGACSHCAETLQICHMCRMIILKKINLY